MRCRTVNRGLSDRTLLKSAENDFLCYRLNIFFSVVPVLTLTMTIQESAPLDANGVSLPIAGAQILKNGPSSSLPDIDVCQIKL